MRKLAPLSILSLRGSASPTFTGDCANARVAAASYGNPHTYRAATVISLSYFLHAFFDGSKVDYRFSASINRR